MSESITIIKSELPKKVLQSVIVVNDGSSSGITDDAVASLISEVPELKMIEYSKNQGKGYALRFGVKSSDADIQIYTDVDVPYDNKAIADFYNLLAINESDIVLTSRDDSYYRSLSIFRRVLSKSLRWMNGILFGLKLKDTQGGLKGFNAAGKMVFLQTRVNRYLFDLEFIQKASKKDLRLVGVNVKLKPNVSLPSPSPIILLKELHNFIRLLIWR